MKLGLCLDIISTIWKLTKVYLFELSHFLLGFENKKVVRFNLLRHRV